MTSVPQPDEPPFDVEALEKLNTRLSDPGGIDVAELAAVLDEHFLRPCSKEDIQAQREGRPPWKKLVDEVAPVSQYLVQEGLEGTVRFPLDSEPPDAWFSPADGSRPLGIEVTRVLARSRVERAKELRTQPHSIGFMGLADNLPQKDFDKARSHRRALTTKSGVERSIEKSAMERLGRKSDAKFAGHILLLVAPLSSAPSHDWEALCARLSAEAEKTAFSKVALVNSGSRGVPPVTVLDRI